MYITYAHAGGPRLFAVAASVGTFGKMRAYNRRSSTRGIGFRRREHLTYSTGLVMHQGFIAQNRLPTIELWCGMVANTYVVRQQTHQSSDL